MCSHAVYDTERQSRFILPGQFHGVKNRGIVGDGRNFSFAQFGFVAWRMANPARVKQQVGTCAVIQNTVSFKKKRPFFIIKNFVRRQVQFRRVGFHLAKIRVYRVIKGKIGCNAYFTIQSETVIIFIFCIRNIFGFCVGHNFEIPFIRYVFYSPEFAKNINHGRCVDRNQFPLIFFVQPVNPSPDVHSPNMFVFVGKPQLGERYAHLSIPRRISHRRLSIPNRIPVKIPSIFAKMHQVNFLSGRRNIKFKRGLFVVVRIEGNSGHIAIVFVASPQNRAHFFRFVIVANDSKIEVIIIIKDFYLGFLRRRFGLMWLLLDKTAVPNANPFPTLVIELSVDFGYDFRSGCIINLFIAGMIIYQRIV